jgi:hypothetical protein
MRSLHLVASVAKCSVHTSESGLPGHVVTPSMPQPYVYVGIPDFVCGHT